MTSFHQGVRRLLVAHGFLSEMAMIWSSFGVPQTMKFLKLRFGERPHFVSEQWPLLYRGPDEVHRKCIGTDIICREFACRQESSLVVYCREFSRWQQRKPKFRSEKRWKKHQDMVSFHTLKWVSDVKWCLRVSLIDFGLRGAGRRRRLTKSGGFTNRMALRQFCGVPDVTPDFNPGNLWGPRACYTFSKHVPGGNDLQHASQISSQPRYVTTRPLWSLRWLQQLPRNTSGVFRPDAGCHMMSYGTPYDMSTKWQWFMMINLGKCVQMRKRGSKFIKIWCSTSTSKHVEVFDILRLLSAYSSSVTGFVVF